jgi:hypothetical protein
MGLELSLRLETEKAPLRPQAAPETSRISGRKRAVLADRFLEARGIREGDRRSRTPFGTSWSGASSRCASSLIPDGLKLNEYENM